MLDRLICVDLPNLSTTLLTLNHSRTSSASRGHTSPLLRIFTQSVSALILL